LTLSAAIKQRNIHGDKQITETKNKNTLVTPQGDTLVTPQGDTLVTLRGAPNSKISLCK